MRKNSHYYQSLCWIQGNFIFVTEPAVVVDLDHHLQQLEEAIIIVLATAEAQGTSQILVIIDITPDKITGYIQATVINFDCNISHNHYYIDNWGHNNSVNRINYSHIEPIVAAAAHRVA